MYIYDRERTAPLASIPRINKVTPWDGKDAEIVQEDIPLDQLFGEEETL